MINLTVGRRIISSWRHHHSSTTTKNIHLTLRRCLTSSSSTGESNEDIEKNKNKTKNVPPSSTSSTSTLSPSSSSSSSIKPVADRIQSPANIELPKGPMQTHPAIQSAKADALDAADARQKAFDPDAVKKYTSDGRYVIVPPDNVPYDPWSDPKFDNRYYDYKYPHYFFKHLGVQKIVRSLKTDFNLMRQGRVHKRREELGVPNHVDIAIFGGGIIGTSIAYFLKEKAPWAYTVGVFERDPTYTRASTTLSAGGIRQQFAQPENILMSLFTSDFLRNSKRNLAILDGEPPDVGFTPQGYLTLATEEHAQQLIDAHKLQIELGALVELYTVDRLKEKFPHLNLDGVVLGSFGVQNEGWFDPWALLLSLKAKAQFLGTEFVHAELVDFNVKSHQMYGRDTRELINQALVREPDGTLKQVEFSLGVICGGYNSGEIARLLGYGNRDNDIRSMRFPIEPRKRYVYVFNCRDGPVLDFPFLIDTSGVYCRREGLGGNYICGRSPRTPGEEPEVNNLDVDYSYFDNYIHPALAARVPAFEAIKLKGGWSGFYDYNVLDQNPIIGYDPYFQNIIWATGFSGHGLQMGPAVGRAVMELLIYDDYQTIDLQRYGITRVLQNRPLEQELCW